MLIRILVVVAFIFSLPRVTNAVSKASAHIHLADSKMLFPLY